MVIWRRLVCYPTANADLDWVCRFEKLGGLVVSELIAYGMMMTVVRVVAMSGIWSSVVEEKPRAWVMPDMPMDDSNGLERDAQGTHPFYSVYLG